MRELVSKCLVKDPAKRPTAAQVRSTPLNECCVSLQLAPNAPAQRPTAAQVQQLQALVTTAGQEPACSQRLCLLHPSCDTAVTHAACQAKPACYPIRRSCWITSSSRPRMTASTCRRVLQRGSAGLCLWVLSLVV